MRMNDASTLDDIWEVRRGYIETESGNNGDT